MDIVRLGCLRFGRGVSRSKCLLVMLGAACTMLLAVHNHRLHHHHHHSYHQGADSVVQVQVQVQEMRVLRVPEGLPMTPPLHNQQQQQRQQQRQQAEKTFVGRHDLHHAFSIQEPTSVEQGCEPLYIGTSCSSIPEMSDVIEMVKTVLEHRIENVILHVVARTEEICDVLALTFNTWALDGVFFKCQLNEEPEGEFSAKSVLRSLVNIQRLHRMDKMLLVHPQLRFTISPRQYLIDTISEALFTVSSSNTAGDLEHIDLLPLVVSLLSYKKQLADIMNMCDAQLHCKADEVYSAGVAVSAVPWYIRPCDNDKNRADDNVDDFSYWMYGCSTEPQLPDELIAIRNKSPHVYRNKGVENTCLTKGNVLVQKQHTDKCKFFRDETEHVYMTQLYFINEPVQTWDEFDTTLMTMFTMNRLEHFIGLVSAWGSGPIIAVLYLGADEIESTRKLLTSDELLGAPNVVYHLVHATGTLTPMNYMRNLALDTVRTPWLLYDDVDLEVTHGAYQQFKVFLKQEKERNVDEYMKTAYVLPAFNTHRGRLDEENFPKKKSDVLKLIHEGSIAGWGLSTKKVKGNWPYSHRNTNYKKWYTATVPYKVGYEHRWEPYMLLSSSSVARYDESLAERVRPKMGYTLALYVEGFHFAVIPDMFVIHQPHPPSKNWKQLQRHMQLYKSCGSKIYSEYVTRLQHQFPNITFTKDVLAEVSKQ